MLEFFITYKPYFWCLSAFFFGMAVQDTINRKSDNPEPVPNNEDESNPNELFVKYLYTDGKFAGFRFIQNGDFYFRFNSFGRDVHDSFKNAATGLSGILKKIEEAHKKETESSKET